MTKTHAKLPLNFNLSYQQTQYFGISEFSAKCNKLFYTLLQPPFTLINRTNEKNTNVRDRYKKYSKFKSNNSRTNDRKTQHKKRRDKNSIVSINIHKLEDLCLSAEDKAKFKKIIKLITLENENEIDNKKTTQKIAPKHRATPKKGSIKSNCNIGLVGELQDSSCRKRSSDIVLKDCKKTDSKSTAHKVNPGRPITFESKPKRTVIPKEFKLPTGHFEQPPEEHCDHIDFNITKNASKTLLRENNSLSITRSVLKVKPSINIHNVRFKCINPTCIVQYSTDSNGDHPPVMSGGRSVQRLSTKIIEKPEDLIRENTYLTDEEEDYVIAKGRLTTEDIEKTFNVLKEVRKSIFPSESVDTEDSQKQKSFNMRGKSLGELMRHQKKLSDELESCTPSGTNLAYSPCPGNDNFKRPQWDVESFPSTLHDLETNVPKCRDPGDKTESKLRKNSILYKIKGCFIKTCFCLWCEDYSKSPYQENNTISQARNKFTETKQTPRLSIKDKYKIVRTTKSQFLDKPHKAT